MQPTYTHYCIYSLLIISLSLLGLSLLYGAGVNNVHAIFDFYQLANVIPQKVQSILAGGAFLATVLFIVLSLKQSYFQAPAFVSLIVLAVIPLITLLSESRWMTDLGGFPIIGSGQGIIKYTALISLAIYLYKPQRLSAQGMAVLNFFPVALVLIWIGGVKFYEFEANGIVPLVSTSVFMSWLYTLFSVQTASDLIGIYDIFFALALALAIIKKHPLAIYVSALGCSAVFLMTQTFLYSAEGAFDSSTLLASLGLFVIKDLWFVANLLVIAYFAKKLNPR
ncbi:YkgB family protein [Pseudoalteromonas sp. KG3]|uniref:DUF417 family protein n=1 Tax=Pseudoalteromonas TaxID=53246 RepID=UPI0024BBF7D0|nr:MULTISPECIES: DUF417 family protein [Pseudoalteromonas]WKD22852.1 YkgB family protein [Pseudoalteromonas sp. KG3]